MTGNEARERILTLAQRMANNDSRKPDYLGGDIFALPNDYEKLWLWFDRTLVDGAIQAAQERELEDRSREAVMFSLVNIIKDAIQRAMHMEADACAAVILEEIHAAATRTNRSV